MGRSGGIYRDLRKQSAQGMGQFDFAVHPIGGIVPIMEQHRYKDLAKIMLSTIGDLPLNDLAHVWMWSSNAFCDVDCTWERLV